jgi:RNA 3'-terminal phosphate cyclase (ATP)
MINKTADPIEIDGSMGEGGGQVLRSSLALSMITGNPVHITNIRAGREKPGIRAQHLAAVDAAAAVSKAVVEGAQMGASRILFQPAGIRTGRYKFKIQTAGAATLVLQTIFIPLSIADSSSTTIITGGTHVSWSPCFHYLALQWLPFLQKVGYDANLIMDQAGFYPRGGGRLSATVRPAKKINPLNLTNRGKLLRITGISAVANLPQSIAERQKRQALLRLQKLPWEGLRPEIRIKLERVKSPGKGTFLILLAEFEGGRCCFTGLGKLGKPAERVADEAVDELFEFLATDGVIDQYLADQLLLPLSIAGGPSTFRTSQVTQHLLTNAAVIQEFLSVSFYIDGQLGLPGLVHIVPKEKQAHSQ